MRGAEEEALRRAHDELELRVQERTTELARANEALQVEIAERKRAEEVLRESEEGYRLYSSAKGCINPKTWRGLTLLNAPVT
jgi:phosphoglycerate-specific signal transduction histidine kinase